MATTTSVLGPSRTNSVQKLMGASADSYYIRHVMVTAHPSYVHTPDITVCL